MSIRDSYRQLGEGESKSLTLGISPLLSEGLLSLPVQLRMRSYLYKNNALRLYPI